MYIRSEQHWCIPPFTTDPPHPMMALTRRFLSYVGANGTKHEPKHADNTPAAVRSPVIQFLFFEPAENW